MACQAVFAGRAVGELLERTSEVGRILEAGLIANAGNRHLAVVEQIFGEVHALVQDVIREAKPIGFLEQAAEAKCRHAAALCQFPLIDAVSKVLFDVQHDIAQRLVFLMS
ncbi:hypothetical protein D9M69_601890 [compost metagenome]